MSVRKVASDFGNVVLVACAVIVTALVVKTYLLGTSRGRPPAIRMAPDRYSNWQPFMGGGSVIGDTTSPLEVVVYSDFECPACKVLSEELRARRKAANPPFKTTYKHLPLTSHRFAEKAAIASECAARQNRFEAMHDVLFANQRQIGVVSWSAFAAQAGVPDTGLFVACQADSTILKRIQSQIAEAESLRVQATPTVLMTGGTRFTGVPSREVLDSIFLAAAKSSRH